MNWILITIAFLMSCLFSFILIPYIRNWISQKKSRNEDNNKFKKPRVRSLEGLLSVLLFFVVISIILTIQTFTNEADINTYLLFTSLLSIAVIAFIGFVDDILGFPNRTIRNIFFLCAIVPMLTTVINQNQPVTDGIINRTNIYFLIAVPIIIILSSALFNGIKSFNKINLSLGSIITVSLFIMAIYEQNYTSQLILSTIGGIFIFLQMYNFTNIKLSLGKVGRFSLGTIVASAAILQNTIIPFLILLIPYLIYHLIYKKNFDREQKKLRLLKTSNDSPEQTDKFQNAFLYLTLLEIIFSVIAITAYLKL